MVGLLVVAWWLAQASATVTDTTLQGYWPGVWSRLTPAGLATRRPSVALWIALLPLAIGFEIVIGSVRLGYVPVLGLFLVLAWMAARYDGVFVSRQAFWMLVILSVIAVGGEPFDETPYLSLRTFSANAVDLVLLAAVPLLAARLDLSQIDISRLLCFGFLAAWTVSSALVGGWVLDDLSLLTVRIEYENTSGTDGFLVTGTRSLPLPLVGWLATLLAVEVCARLLARTRANRLTKGDPAIT